MSNKFIVQARDAAIHYGALKEPGVARGLLATCNELLDQSERENNSLEAENAQLRSDLAMLAEVELGLRQTASWLNTMLSQTGPDWNTLQAIRNTASRGAESLTEYRGRLEGK